MQKNNKLRSAAEATIEPLLPRMLLAANLDGATLRIEGTDADDRIVVALHRRYINVLATSINGAERYFALGDVAHVAVMAGAGNDRVLIDSSIDDLQINSWVEGEAGRDTLIGNSWNDTLRGGEGNDLLFGNAGADSLDGGAGNDSLLGGNVGDTLDGGSGNDTLLGERGSDILRGSGGNDAIRGGGGDDRIDAGAGDDSSLGDAGRDTLHGEEGADTLRGGDGYDSIEGGIGDDSLAGEADSDTLRGGAGDDAIFGGDNGYDQLHGDGGNDNLRAGTFTTAMYGGDGNDTLTGGPQYDKLYGEAGDDHITGAGGFDELSGGEGNDLLEGGADGDKLEGGAGNDALYGGAGDDQLLGGDGNDNLYGGDVNDRRTSDDGQDTGLGGAGTDWWQPDHDWKQTDVQAQESGGTQNAISTDPGYTSGAYSGSVSYSNLAANFNSSGSYINYGNMYGGTVATQNPATLTISNAPAGAYQIRALGGAGWLYGGTPVDSSGAPIAENRWPSYIYNQPTYGLVVNTIDREQIKANLPPGPEYSGFTHAELSSRQRTDLNPVILVLPSTWRIGGMATARDGIVWYRLSSRANGRAVDSVGDAGTWRFLAVKAGTVLVTASPMRLASPKHWLQNGSLVPLPSRGTVTIAGQSPAYSLVAPPETLPQLRGSARAILVDGGAVVLGAEPGAVVFSAGR